MSAKTKTTPDYKKVLLDLVASLTLCDNMSDVCGDVQEAMDQIGIECDVDLSEGSTGPFIKILHNLGAKTLNGVEIWDKDDEEEESDGEE